MLSFNLQLLLAGFADPVVLAFEKGVVVYAIAFIFSTQVAFHMAAGEPLRAIMGAHDISVARLERRRRRQRASHIKNGSFYL
jgi:hypothetical protein